MGADRDKRIAVAEQVSRILGHPEAEAVFPAFLPNGKRHVLVALPNDTYRVVLERVKRFRGPVNVAVGCEAGGIEVVIFHPSDATIGHKKVDDCEVSGQSEVGLLVALLRRTRKTTRVNLVKPRYDAELVDQETAVLAEL